MSDLLTILQGDALEKLRELPEESVQCCITSPPFWGLRNYGCDGQLGLEETPDKYVARLVEVFREARRVLRKDGTLWLNLGDSYYNYRPGKGQRVTKQTLQESNGSSDFENCLRRGTRQEGLKEKDLVGIPWMVAFALRADGWWLRSDIIWNKANCMPESVTDRPTRSHEYLFLLSKAGRYYYDAEAIKEPASEADWESRIGRANLNNKLLPTDEINEIRPRVKYTPNAKEKPHGSTLTGGLYGRHHLRDAIPEKERREDKQRRHSRRHDGFNDRWDEMEKSEQCSGMRNKRDVWTIAPANYPEAHFATYPTDLIKPCILAGTRVGDVILDPFAGSFTTCMVALELGRKAIGIELNPAYVELGKRRCEVTVGLPLA